MLLRARFVLPVSSEAIEDGAVVVRGGRIHAVGPHARLASAHPGERLRDLGEAILFPGLVNAHSHLEITLLRGLLDEMPFFPWLRRLVELKGDGLKVDESVFYSLLGAAEMIRGGTTTVADCSDTGAPFDALALSGLRGIVYQEVFAPSRDRVGAAIAGLEARLDALQAMATDRVSPGISPHSPYMACERLLRESLEVAGRRGLPVSLHVAESDGEDAFIREGQGPIADHFQGRGWPVEARGCSPVEWIERCGWLDAPVQVQLVHLARAGQGDLELIAEAARQRPLGVAACPRSNASLGNGLPNLGGLTALGIPWGLGSDGAPSCGSLDMLAEMRFAGLAERGRTRDALAASARRMLARVTLEAARSLGLGDHVGSLEPGKQADLAAVSLRSVALTPAFEPHSVVASLATPRDVILTMVGGEILYEDGEVRTIDEERVAARCRERATLLGRLARR